ncbi:IBR finger domain protein [Rutstroemia sp. NJR-2017a BBW]|nr:IBR finger domain protein [Rutstroemia sp. NJR-2017a BBW]
MSLSADELTAQMLQAEWDREDDLLHSQLQFAVTVGTGHDAPLTQFELDMLEAQRLQAELAAEDNQNGLGRLRGRFESEDDTTEEQVAVAQEISQADARRAARLEREMEEAQRIALEWETEDTRRQQRAINMQREWEEKDRRILKQEAFAKRLSKREEARLNSLDRDMAAAQAAQAQWEREVQEQREQAKRLATAEQKRVSDARKKAVEVEQKAKIDKEKAARKAKLEKERKANEEAARKIQLEQQKKEKQRLADAKRAKELAEKEKKAAKADCASCMEAGEKANMCMLPCKHAYCGECIAGAFQNALSSKTRFKCCKTNISVGLATRWLEAPFIASYELLILEQTTKNPRYCSNKTCNKFVPPADIHASIAVCSACNTRTCAPCGNAEHAGVCKEDAQGKIVQELAAKNGWKSCPQCNFVIEKNEGCLHMTCLDWGLLFRQFEIRGG